MIIFIKNLIIYLFALSVIGYILVVIKEKVYLNKNMIVLDNKYITPKHLSKADIKSFMINGTIFKSGDEIKLVTKKQETFKGMLIGAIKKDASVLFVTNDNIIVKLEFEKISRLKIISKYGKFL